MKKSYFHHRQHRAKKRSWLRPCVNLCSCFFPGGSIGSVTLTTGETAETIPTIMTASTTNNGATILPARDVSSCLTPEGPGHCLDTPITNSPTIHDEDAALVLAERVQSLYLKPECPDAPDHCLPDTTANDSTTQGNDDPLVLAQRDQSPYSTSDGPDHHLQLTTTNNATTLYDDTTSVLTGRDLPQYSVSEYSEIENTPMTRTRTITTVVEEIIVTSSSTRTIRTTTTTITTPIDDDNTDVTAFQHAPRGSANSLELIAGEIDGDAGAIVPHQRVMNQPDVYPPPIDNIVGYLHPERHGKLTVDTEHETILPWKESTCLPVVCYVTKFCSNPEENRPLSDTIRYLEELASLIMKGSTQQNNLKKKQDEFSKELLESFIPKVFTFFSFPLCDLEKDIKLKLLAGFIDFLIQTLNHQAYIHDLDEEHMFVQLQKAISFLFNLLGDQPFQCSHRELVEEVNVLLFEFERLADKAGRFIYSFVFPTEDASMFHQDSDALLQEFLGLDDSISQHCHRFSELRIYETSSFNVVDSFFVFDSLIEDIDNVTNGRLKITPDACIKDHIDKLKQELTHTRAHLKEVEERQATEANIFEPLIQIRDLAYEAEYIINSLVVGNIPSWYADLRLGLINEEIGHARIFRPINKEKITGELTNVSKEVSSQKNEKNASMDDSYIVDSENTYMKILDNLVGLSRMYRQIIAIFGMPGIGKTTTARKLYNDRAVFSYFDRLAWCTVSQNYSLRKLLIHILGNIYFELSEDEMLKMGLSELGCHVYKTLFGRRYLIVFDDIWNSDVLDQLKRYFPDNGNGSRILLTTRIMDAARGASITYELPFLTNEQCWSLLNNKVFPRESCPSYLVEIGKKIAAKCHGVPLAVVTIAGILINLETAEFQWETVEQLLESLLLDGEDYRKILELSYEHLPHNLKPCFLYFGAFPEDDEISVEKLLWLWVAQGFIPRDETKSSEEIAETYLLDLINRSLVLTAKWEPDGGLKTCRIHDLLLDICVNKADENNFLKFTSDYSSYEKHQRMCLNSTPSTYWRPFGHQCCSLTGYLSNKSSSFQTMPLLKVVDMLPYRDHSYAPTFDLPVQLKYLGVDCKISKRMVSKLVNLEYICVSTSQKVHVPSVILKMSKLRHCLIRKVAKFKDDGDIQEDTNLRSLAYVCIYKESHEKILKHSPHLRKLKCTYRGDRTFDLSLLSELESLKLCFKVSEGHRRLSNFVFPYKIKKLSFNGVRLHWNRMSEIGDLPHLCVLKLGENAFYGDEWEIADEQFQKLKFLKIVSGDLKRWIVCDEHFPSLERLVLDKCSKLEEIPNDLGFINTLQRIDVLRCTKEACLSAIEIEEEQREYGNDLQVNITHSKWTKEGLIEEKEGCSTENQLMITN